MVKEALRKAENDTSWSNIYWSSSIAGRGSKKMKITGRGSIWVEKRWSRWHYILVIKYLLSPRFTSSSRRFSMWSKWASLKWNFEVISWKQRDSSLKIVFSKKVVLEKSLKMYKNYNCQIEIWYMWCSSCKHMLQLLHNKKCTRFQRTIKIT